MTKIAPSLQYIHEEETKRDASVSESVMKKFGGASNFWFDRFGFMKTFQINGNYRQAVGSIGVDGVRVFQHDSEIIGVQMWSLDVGGLGTPSILSFDIQWLDQSGSLSGSIFSTTPKIPNAAGNYTYISYDVLNSTPVGFNPGGVVYPVLTKTQFEAGDAIICKIDSAIEGGSDAGISIIYRPI